MKVKSKDIAKELGLSPATVSLVPVSYTHLKEELKTFSHFQSRLIGHPSTKVPGVEMNTGALGHGLPIAVGMALAGKRDQKDYHVYVLMGDGGIY